ncbi:chloride conductance regulatory protein ICln-like [Aristolochia californica]|uniref:chloride conductance regulatory protein ICln-like n=1 Tax=Aristolochia californica TaxID=171875 RepID=UPI0035DB873C
MGLGLRHFTDRIQEGESAGHPLLDTENGEELLHVQPAVAIVLGNLPPESPGTLFISSKQVVWLSGVDVGKGYAVDFLSISLHAVSRDAEAYPSPCIYAQIETEGGEDEEREDSDSEASENFDLSKITEMRLVPSDPSQLDTLFNVFCECAELNPEPRDEQDDENEWIFGPDQMVDDVMAAETEEGSDWPVYENPANPIGYANGEHDLARNVLELQIDDQRFEDAEEAEQGAHSAHQ